MTTTIKRLAQAMEQVHATLSTIDGPGLAEAGLADAMLGLEDEILAATAVTLEDAFIQLRAVASILDDENEDLADAVRSAMGAIGDHRDAPGAQPYAAPLRH